MSQAIKLPANITHSKIMQKEIADYAREVAMVGIILSDNYMKSLYEAQGTGYIACIDTLHDWAVECVAKFAHVEEWEEFIDSDANPYKGRTMCWDDVVIAFGEEKMKENHYTILQS